MTDFEDGVDRIDLSRLIGAPDAQWFDLIGYGATLDGTGTVIWVNNDFLILENFDVANLDASDFIV